MRSPAAHWILVLQREPGDPKRPGSSAEMLTPSLGSGGVTEKLHLIPVSRTRFLCRPAPWARLQCRAGTAQQEQQDLEAMGGWTRRWVGASKGSLVKHPE